MLYCMNLKLSGHPLSHPITNQTRTKLDLFQIYTKQFSNNNFYIAFPSINLFLYWFLALRFTKLNSIKGKGRSVTFHVNKERQYNYSSSPPYPQRQMGVGGQSRVLAALIPVKDTGTCFTGGWMGRRVDMNGLGEEVFPPPGCEHRNVHPVASRYTGYSVPAPTFIWLFVFHHAKCSTL